MAIKKPFGTITRGTTNPNRLRRIDRFIAAQPLLRRLESPIVVDLGFGASPTTAVELRERLSKINSDVHVIGIEIDRERVERGLAVATDHLHFTHGGFEVPLPSGLATHADIIRAFNVLRQYDESEVAAAWSTMQARLSPQGLLIEGTCDEIGRLASWVTLDRNQPLSLTVSLRLNELDLPSKVAERLPKALIHHNLPGEKIHDFLKALDLAWQTNAGLGAFGASQRWVAACQQLAEAGWPLIGDKKRWRLGEISVEWAAVEPE